MATIYKRRDTRPILEMALTEDSLPLDLTSVTTANLLLSQDGTALQVPCAIQAPPTGGILLATLGTAVTGTATTYQVEVQLTYSDGGIETVPNSGYGEITIEPDLGP
jgi:hypothetical protein